MHNSMDSGERPITRSSASLTVSLSASSPARVCNRQPAHAQRRHRAIHRAVRGRRKERQRWKRGLGHLRSHCDPTSSPAHRHSCCPVTPLPGPSLLRRTPHCFAAALGHRHVSCLRERTRRTAVSTWTWLVQGQAHAFFEGGWFEGCMLGCELEGCRLQRTFRSRKEDLADEDADVVEQPPWPPPSFWTAAEKAAYSWL